MGEKSERWAFARIQELEHELSRWRAKYWEMRRYRDFWRNRAIRKKAKQR